MMRLIDADVFRSILSDALNKPGVTSPIIRSLMRTIIYSLDAMPTVDAVPVVRCWECKWFGLAGCAIQIVDDTDKPSEDDFCSFGERKGGNE